MLIGGVNSNQQTAQDIAATLADTNQDGLAQMEDLEGAMVEDVLELSSENTRKPIVDSDGKMDIETLKQQMASAIAQGEAMGSMMEERIKCLKIAMNIMAGDKVSFEDIQFLAEKDPDMYARSVNMRRTDTEPQNVERVSEDEEEAAVENGEEGANKRIGSSSAPPQAKTEAAAPAGDGAPAPETAGDGANE